MYKPGVVWKFHPSGHIDYFKKNYFTNEWNDWYNANIMPCLMSYRMTQCLSITEWFCRVHLLYSLTFKECNLIKSFSQDENSIKTAWW